MSDTFKSWADLVYKAAVILCALGVIYMKATFATKEDVKAILDAVHALDTSSAIHTNDVRHMKERLGDLETRVRSLERN